MSSCEVLGCRTGGAAFTLVVRAHDGCEEVILCPKHLQELWKGLPATIRETMSIRHRRGDVMELFDTEDNPIYWCPGCRSYVPWSDGADDDRPELCDNCWGRNHKQGGTTMKSEKIRANIAVRVTIKSQDIKGLTEEQLGQLIAQRGIDIPAMLKEGMASGKLAASKICLSRSGSKPTALVGDMWAALITCPIDTVPERRTKPKVAKAEVDILDELGVSTDDTCELCGSSEVELCNECGGKFCEGHLNGSYLKGDTFNCSAHHKPEGE